MKTKLTRRLRAAAPAILMALAACSSPLETCVGRAETEYAGLLMAIDTAEANIARGYAVERDLEARNVPVFCTSTAFGRRHVGVGLTGCTETRVRTVARPVPLNIEEEEAKLASMLRRLPAARERRDAAIGACHARFPA